MDKLKELWQKIKTQREYLWLTQTELAAEVWIDRTFLWRIETWEREPRATDVEKIADVLWITSQYLIESKIDLIEDYYNKAIINEWWNNSNKKLGNLILYILSKCWDKPNVWKTVLYKMIYYCISDYKEQFRDSKKMINLWFEKLPHWPTPDKVVYDNTLEYLIDEKKIQKIKTFYYWKKQHKLVPTQEYNVSNFSDNEISVIDSTINFFHNMNATEVSDYSHNDPARILSNYFDKINENLRDMNIRAMVKHSYQDRR